MFTAQQLRARANQFVNKVPYILGSQWTAATKAPALPKAVDCSELVEGLYRENGTPFKTGDPTASAEYDACTAVTNSKYRPGDLVFLKNNAARKNGIGHVGILVWGSKGIDNNGYIVGEPEIIEARGHAYGCQRHTLSFWKARGHYAGVRRYPGFKLATTTTTAPVKPPIPAPVTPATPKPEAVIGYTNLGQQNGWASRKAKVKDVFKKNLRASVYCLTECDEAMATELAVALGWGKPGQPAWRVDENRNAVLWDRSKWVDVTTHQTSLSAKPGDLGDRHFRSANWVLLRHLATGRTCWFGASHLSNGDAATDREVQAKRLVADMPKDGIPKILGIDRNSYETSDPAKTLVAGGLPLLTPNLGDTFIGDGIQAEKKAIDGIHGTVAIRDVTLIKNAAATDHAMIRASITIPTAK